MPIKRGSKKSSSSQSGRGKSTKKSTKKATSSRAQAGKKSPSKKGMTKKSSSKRSVGSHAKSKKSTKKRAYSKTAKEVRRVAGEILAGAATGAVIGALRTALGELAAEGRNPGDPEVPYPDDDNGQSDEIGGGNRGDVW